MKLNYKEIIMFIKREFKDKVDDKTLEYLCVFIWEQCQYNKNNFLSTEQFKAYILYKIKELGINFYPSIHFFDTTFKGELK